MALGAIWRVLFNKLPTTMSTGISTTTNLPTTTTTSTTTTMCITIMPIGMEIVGLIIVRDI